MCKQQHNCTMQSLIQVLPIKNLRRCRLLIVFLHSRLSLYVTFSLIRHPALWESYTYNSKARIAKFLTMRLLRHAFLLCRRVSTDEYSMSCHAMPCPPLTRCKIRQPTLYHEIVLTRLKLHDTGYKEEEKLLPATRSAVNGNITCCQTF
jgi:hypothetical protein